MVYSHHGHKLNTNLESRLNLVDKTAQGTNIKYAVKPIALTGNR